MFWQQFQESLNISDMERLTDRPTCPYSKIGAEFDPFCDVQVANPYPFYARARREEPVFFSSILRTWYVTRYDDIITVLNDSRRFSSADAVNSPFDYVPSCKGGIRTSWRSEASLLNRGLGANSLYPLQRISHDWIRRALKKAFTKGQIADLETRIRDIANDLIDRLLIHGRAEFVSDFSRPLPMRVILNVLGAPENDTIKLKRWGEDWIALASRELATQEQGKTVSRLSECQEYWLALIEERRARPQNDLVSILIAASQREETPTSAEQIVNACSVFALAGHETTTNLLSICLYRLLSIPEQWQLVCHDRTNVPRAIEETLRADTSVPALMRTTTETVELGGVRIPQGARLALSFASANHDEAYFSDAARFELRREDATRHLAFGRGIHSCLGAPLARIEGRVALELLIERLPGLRLATGRHIAFMVNPIHRGLKELPIEWTV